MAFIEGTNGNDNLAGTDDIDQMSGLDGNDTLHGLGGNDDLRGWGGHDFVYGDDGNDALWSTGVGDDFMDGGAGSDWIIYTTVGHGVAVNLEFGTGRAIDTGIDHHDTLVGIENIGGSRHDDHLQGNTANNVIRGNIGNDVILGWEGDDLLEGDSGADTIIGGEGNDTIAGNDFNDDEFFDGSNGFDFLDIRSADQKMFVSLQENVSHALASASVDVDSIFNFEGVIGSEFVDVIHGDANDNWLQGNEGDDRLLGGAGFDTLDGGGGTDRFVWRDGDGNDRVDGSFGFFDAQFVGASDSAEKFTLLTFFSGPAYILGIEGGASGDSALLLDGVEVLVVRARGGADTLTVQDISATSLTGSIRYLAGTGNDTLAGGLADIAIEADGRAGNDSLEAGAGNDTLTGGTGLDMLIGSGGADDLQGDAGNDTLAGGAGSDELIGSTGKDRLTGGKDADVFDFNGLNESGVTIATADHISDFVHFTDHIDLSAIDAIIGGANNPFIFIGNNDFTAVGQVRVRASGSDTIVALNTSGTDGAEMLILLENIVPGALTSGDFIL